MRAEGKEESRSAAAAGGVGESRRVGERELEPQCKASGNISTTRHNEID